MMMLRCKAAALAALLALALLLPGCAWLDVKQRGWIYRPTPGVLADWQPITDNDEPIWLERPATGPDGQPQRLRAIWVPAADPDAPGVLYLHGTFRNLFQNRAKIAAIQAAGFSVLAVDYRGWGESTHLLPSEDSIVEDAETAWAEFARRVPQPNQRIIFGHSMGSGVAVELAVRHRAPPGYGALVLESAMTSMPDIARDQGLVGSVGALLTTQHFSSIDKIGLVGAPKWFLSGSADRTVPSHQSQRLYDAAPAPKVIEIFPGGSHSGLAQEFETRYREVWQAVAATLAAAPQSGPIIPPGRVVDRPSSDGPRTLFVAVPPTNASGDLR
jgi:alpha-beta hydrolase superfamily lysophospholipase